MYRCYDLNHEWHSYRYSFTIAPFFLLVDTLLEHTYSTRRILDLYDVAIKEEFRFYSFGDAMLII